MRTPSPPDPESSTPRQVAWPLRRPPAGVVLVASTHAVVGGVIVASTLLLHWLTRGLPAIEFGPRTYAYTGGLAGLYLLAAVLVWFGAPFGPLLSRICSLLYLPRPSFGFRIWDTMNSPEFRAHFQRRRMEPATSARSGTDQ